MFGVILAGLRSVGAAFQPPLCPWSCSAPIIQHRSMTSGLRRTSRRSAAKESWSSPPSPMGRRAAEDALKAHLTHAECTASYSLLRAEAHLKDIAKVSAALKAAGMDGTVVMRPMSDENEVSYR